MEKSKNHLAVHSTCKHTFQVDFIDIRDGFTCSSALLPTRVLRTQEKCSQRATCALYMSTDERFGHKVNPEQCRYMSYDQYFRMPAMKGNKIATTDYSYNSIDLYTLMYPDEFDLLTYLTQQKSILYLEE